MRAKPDLAGQTVVVIGGSSGIGLELGRALPPSLPPTSTPILGGESREKVTYDKEVTALLRSIGVPVALPTPIWMCSSRRTASISSSSWDSSHTRVWTNLANISFTPCGMKPTVPRTPPEVSSRHTF